jgi:hypothetical protein
MAGWLELCVVAVLRAAGPVVELGPLLLLLMIAAGATNCW